MREHEEESQEWIAGKHPVMEALRSGREINKIWVAEQAQKNAQPIMLEAKKAGHRRPDRRQAQAGSNGRRLQPIKGSSRRRRLTGISKWTSCWPREGKRRDAVLPAARRDRRSA